MVDETRINVLKKTRDRLVALKLYGNMDRQINHLIGFYETHNTKSYPKLEKELTEGYRDRSEEVDRPGVDPVIPTELQGAIKTIDDIVIPEYLIQDIKDYYNNLSGYVGNTDVLISAAIKKAKEKTLEQVLKSFRKTQEIHDKERSDKESW